MNGAWLHLGTVHLPIALAAVSVVLVLFALVTKSPARLKFALEIIVIGAVLSWATFLTGEEAEEVVEDFRGNVQERLSQEDDDLKHFIHEHEEFAELAHYAFQGAGALALVGWFFCRKADKLRMPLGIIALVAAGTTAGMMGWTGHLGGLIRHIEIREDVLTAPGPEPVPDLRRSNEESTEDDHDR